MREKFKIADIVLYDRVQYGSKNSRYYHSAHLKICSTRREVDTINIPHTMKRQLFLSSLAAHVRYIGCLKNILKKATYFMYIRRYQKMISEWGEDRPI